ncbi:aminotransferase [Sporodiniella umbellata]|nr:aminotransferase [Sporodiniella umbellata]
MFKRMFSAMSKTIPETLIIERVDAVNRTVWSRESFNEFILSRPRGAYTGMRTLHGHRVVAFESHLQRLKHSLLTMVWEPYSPTEPLFTDVEALRDQLVPILCQGLDVYGGGEGRDTKISVLVSYCFEKQQPIVAAHFSPMGVTPATAKVLVSHRSRTDPTVKDSRWVAQRSDLEAEKPQDVNEVLLVHDGHVYEGMASNFFAVKRVDGRPALVCAGLEHVLLGTIMKMVIRLCEQEGIAILWEFPKLDEATDWEGCFLTSTSRLLLPIDTLYHGAETIRFESTAWIEHLQQLVLKEIEKTSYAIQ